MKNLGANAKSAVATLIFVLAGGPVSLAAEKPAFNKHQKEFYLSEQELAFYPAGSCGHHYRCLHRYRRHDQGAIYRHRPSGSPSRSERDLHAGSGEH